MLSERESHITACISTDETKIELRDSCPVISIGWIAPGEKKEGYLLIENITIPFIPWSERKGERITSTNEPAPEPNHSLLQPPSNSTEVREQKEMYEEQTIAEYFNITPSVLLCRETATAAPKAYLAPTRQVISSLKASLHNWASHHPATKPHT